MGPDPAARILLCAEDAGGLCRLLEQAGHAVACADLQPNSLRGALACSLVLVDGAGNAPAALALCGRLRRQLGAAFVPILFMSGSGSASARLAGLESGADACLPRPFARGELLALVQSFLRIKDRHDHLTQQTAEVSHIHKRLQAAYHQIEQELTLAGRIQESLLPQTLPELPQVRFAVHYRPRGRVGGDFYDVFRLDEHHLGFYIADVMGHGIPASLLTIFVKKGVRAKEIFGKQYRLVPPGEVLQRLNRDLIDEALSEHPFITMAYVLLNSTEGALSFARSGHPYPLYLPHDGPAELWQLEGTLLGVFDTEYKMRTERLRPGDKVLLYTDGIDAACFESRLPGVPSLLACADRHRALPIQELVGRLAQELFGQTKQTDDLTLLGLEMIVP
jgi:sigma-B regulation protein RsbU (phosphoserine phosphatase)